MKVKIENELKYLLGLPLENAGRSVNLVWFSFGEKKIIKNKDGSVKSVGDYVLHIQCSWRITKGSQILVASRDIYTPSARWKGAEDQFEWDIYGMNRCDERIEELLKENDKSKMIIESIHADSVGGVRMFFRDNCVLELFPDDSNEEEFWRIFIPGNIRSHFIVTGKGIEV